MERSEDDRFAFGENWSRFLTVLNKERIQFAEQSVKKLLGVSNLNDKRFLDIGSGSGLFSLAARRLGAEVCSFDFDAESVACTEELKRRYYPDDATWTVQHGSILDDGFLSPLGQFDAVYSWGVLHHTGNMWQAFENVVPLVRPTGILAISIYNDQGSWSRRWTTIKRMYNRLPRFLQPMFAFMIMAPRELKYLLIDTLKLQPQAYFRNIRQYASRSNRGMSYWHDLRDWIGGYPFEVAKPEVVFDFFRARGFVLHRMSTAGGGSGCNEFVFERLAFDDTELESSAWTR